MGTGIKAVPMTLTLFLVVSYPSRARGLKYIEIEGKYKKMLIVPFVGTGLKNGGRKDEQRRI